MVTLALCESPYQEGQVTSVTSPYLRVCPPPPPPLAAEETLSSCLVPCFASQIPYIPAHTSFPYLALWCYLTTNRILLMCVCVCVCV